VCAIIERVDIDLKAKLSQYIEPRYHDQKNQKNWVQ